MSSPAQSRGARRSDSQYLAEGYAVTAACRNLAAAAALRQLERGSKGALTLVELDVADSASVTHAASRVPSPTIDILVNCAGVTGAPGQTIGALEYGDWAQVLQVNVMGPARRVRDISRYAPRHREIQQQRLQPIFQLR